MAQGTASAESKFLSLIDHLDAQNTFIRNIMGKPRKIIAVVHLFTFWGCWALTGYLSVMSFVSLFSFELGAAVMYFAAAIATSAAMILYIELLKRREIQRNWVVKLHRKVVQFLH